MSVIYLGYRLFGYGIAVTRGIPLFFGALVVVQLVFLVFRLGGTIQVAGISALLLAGNGLFWWVSRSGRMDPESLFFGLLGVNVWLGPRASRNAPPSWRRAALAGLSIGTASMFHVLGAFWGLSLVSADFTMRRKPAWAAWSVAGVTGALALAIWLTWIFYHHLGQIWIMQFWEQQVLLRSAGDLWWLRPLAEFRLFLGQNKLAPFYVLALFAGVGAWCFTRRWRDPNQRFVLGGFLGSLLLVTFLMAKGTGAYPLYWFIWLVPIAAFGWSALLDVALPAKKKWRIAFLATGLVNPFAWQAFTIGVAYYQYAGRNYSTVNEFIARNVLPGSIVCGRPEFWYAVETNDSILRIWTKPDPLLHDFCIIDPGQAPPPGFSFVENLPNRLRTIHGFYFSGTNYAADLYVSLRISARRMPSQTSVIKQSRSAAPLSHTIPDLK